VPSDREGTFDSEDTATARIPRSEKQQVRARNKACREKSRREFLNDCFELLADAVGTEPPLKDKGSILRGAIKEIEALREECARLRAESTRMDGLLKLVLAEPEAPAAVQAPKRAQEPPQATQTWGPPHMSMLQAKTQPAQPEQLLQHRDFLPLWLDPSEFNEELDAAIHPPLA